MAILRKNKYPGSGSNSFRKSFDYLKEFDFIQIFALLSLLAIGVVFIYSTGQQAGTSAALGAWTRQLKWIAVSIPAWALFATVDYRQLKPLTIFFYIITALLLITVLLFGPKINGARRWLLINSINLRLQHPRNSRN